MTQCARRGCTIRLEGQAIKTFPYCREHLRERMHLEVRPSTAPGAGLGLFYVGPGRVEGGSVIARYSGPRIIRRLNRRSNSNYILTLNGSHAGMHLDAEDPMNYPGRYINDYRATKPKPNVRLDTVRVRVMRGRYTTSIVTEHDIEPGTELFADYGPAYWSRAELARFAAQRRGRKFSD